MGYFCGPMPFYQYGRVAMGIRKDGFWQKSVSPRRRLEFLFPYMAVSPTTHENKVIKRAVLAGLRPAFSARMDEGFS
jgi:hypothetical protein